MTHPNFWDAHTHDLLILAGCALFPRITMLFIGGPFNVLHWLGWGFAPHLLVAILATSTYWDTNPILCIIAWFFAFTGSGGEGKAAQRGWQWRRARARASQEVIDARPQ